MWKVDPTSLYLFIAVCEEGSIARAAERELASPAAISKRIADIEKSIGTPLLSRSQKGVTPTAAGQVLLRHARNLIGNIDKLRSELSEYASGVKGHVRLLANVSSITEFLPEELTTFFQKYEHIQVDLEERVSLEIARGVIDGSADLGICRDFVSTGDLHTIPYRSDHFALVVHDKHPLAHRSSLPFEEAIHYEQIGLAPNAAVNVLMTRIAAQKGVELRYRTHITTFDAACRFVQAGLAVAVLPFEVVVRYSHMVGLRIIPLTDAWATRRFIICTRRTDKLSIPARRLLDHLLDRVPAIS
ncbi:LysR family transcriptional regulator [Paralcaligenes ureilyticus]|uniref:LysR family transcriptional regulator n=1 Tax=Paralcaligenes ureilyticus TaxID=627131 RepID=A0A4R3LQP0_9BURK|nr:LysR family transcriptional regulator [Paralcaligenes ureilyticus]TCT02762.1 LysR family transcriptional regulator [Paralcaligenes ureilyticus]